MADLTARERIILAIDTSEPEEARRLARVAADAGARFVKLGLELSSATSWDFCSGLAQEHGLDWVADAKLDDIPNTVEKATANLIRRELPPFGITMHASAGLEAMQAAQITAGETKILGVTVLTSITDDECNRIFGKPRLPKVRDLANDAALAGIAGLVCSPKEVGMISSGDDTAELFTMIPGARSVGADHHDQANVDTPFATIRNGADLLVIGRQITAALNPTAAFEQVVEEIEGAMK